MMNRRHCSSLSAFVCSQEGGSFQFSRPPSVAEFVSANQLSQSSVHNNSNQWWAITLEITQSYVVVTGICAKILTVDNHWTVFSEQRCEGNMSETLPGRGVISRAWRADKARQSVQSYKSEPHQWEKMPLQREHVQFAVIVLCVPLQMFISSYMGSTETSRTHAISQLVSQFHEMRDSWLRLDPWRRWCQRIFTLNIKNILDPDGLDDPNGECPSKEVIEDCPEYFPWTEKKCQVFMFRDKNGYFGQSIEPRATRPPHISFRVGQVVKHKRWGYRGVIIGWDERARAPENWLREMHKHHPEWRNQ